MLMFVMANAHYFYLPLHVPELQRLVDAHQEQFDEFLIETFGDDELSGFERQLDAIAAVFVQPIISELSFDDFYVSESLFKAQQFFFDSCKSSICLENIPDFFENPFQVSYLLQLLSHFDEVLIDTGGVEELVFKSSYVEELKKYKNIDNLIESPLERPVENRTRLPVFPIDFLIQDVYREVDRLKAIQKIYLAMEEVVNLPEKTQKLFKVFLNEKSDSNILLKNSGLNPKDFDDNLERLKFWLRKI